MKDDGCGIGTGFRPGGALGGPGDGVPTGPPAGYGFVRKDVSDVMESMGSRSIGCFPLRFEGGESSFFRADVGSGRAPTALGSVVGIFVAVIGG
jgi:hypothetical protein